MPYKTRQFYFSSKKVQAAKSFASPLSSRKQNLLILKLILDFWPGLPREGCFSINVTKNKKYKTGWRVKLFFYIGLHQKDKALLEKIKSYLGGQINTKHGAQSIQFRVFSVKDLEGIIKHFDKYPLITKNVPILNFESKLFI